MTGCWNPNVSPVLKIVNRGNHTRTFWGGSKIGCKGQYLRDLCGFCILQMLMLDHDQFLGPGVSVHCLLTDWAQLLMLMLSLISRALKRILSDVSNRETERIVFSSFEHLLIYIKNDISENSLKNDIQAYYITLLRNQKVTADSKLSLVSKAVQ